MFADIRDMMAVLQMMYPELEAGIHYILIAEAPEGGKEEEFRPTRHAEILRWRADIPQPSQKALEDFWNANMSAVLTHRLADETRGERNRRLVEADALVERALDKGDAVAERAARDYRQALRDVPTQPGFPDTVDWPVKPS